MTKRNSGGFSKSLQDLSNFAAIGFHVSCGKLNMIMSHRCLKGKTANMIFGYVLKYLLLFWGKVLP